MTKVTMGILELRCSKHGIFYSGAPPICLFTCPECKQDELLLSLVQTLKEIEKTLCIPAAEYVAIEDCFKLIDSAFKKVKAAGMSCHGS